ncbi:ACP S-malonyltransferase, partial [Escherichia coli]|nr:ACP S-malonyltransferase [Escherichia coli]EFT2771905.1 ACP S-malonyltransferase [Escherichia coli]EHC4933542.1 ACP S-malonyltransferase [Escherichia coli]
WHTRLMEDGVQAMRDYLAGLDIASPEHQVLMNVTAKSEVAPSIIKENLSLHLRKVRISRSFLPKLTR